MIRLRRKARERERESGPRQRYKEGGGGEEGRGKRRRDGTTVMLTERDWLLVVECGGGWEGKEDCGEGRKARPFSFNVDVHVKGIFIKFFSPLFILFYFILLETQNGNGGALFEGALSWFCGILRGSVFYLVPTLQFGKWVINVNNFGQSWRIYKRFIGLYFWELFRMF